ncbi:hypothetical protein BDP55DRAFT_708993 [Colletotrichum godetiae]|uniref:Uncharacterized protein n=1 Tax=Colletotrichum godetiae TaxID=1209918 RepID=A0AAJ0A5X1_9PEZI|nr:uncharacterized protein BDP55DRAFT_708993 [Colletotrichum godetiae]KAK1657058.1 hypothetical protein BDP55DRAFT_708993 [Colletotrichum godetiae]
MSVTPESRPRIVAISLKYKSFFDETYARLFTQLLEKASVQRAKKPASALDLLQQQPPPVAVLITDQGLTEGYPDVWDAVIAYVRQGGTAIAMAGLAWDSGAYHRTTVALNPQVAGSAAAKLPGRYSQKALFLKGVHSTAVMYGPDQTSVTESLVFPSERVGDVTQAAISFAKVGDGKIGYVGDVNVEEGTDAAILAMCGLLV